MKYCLSGRQPLSVLKKCDEVRMKLEDIDKMFDYIQTLSDKTFIFNIPITTTEDDIDWRLLNSFQESVRIVLCIADLKLALPCRNHNIEYYWMYKVTTFYELQGLLALQPAYIDIGAPLSFNLDKIKKITNIPLRMTPNNAQDMYIPRITGITGQWVRPEDIPTYEPYVEVFDFYYRDNLEQEATYFKAYKEQLWPSDLNYLICNLNFSVDNRLISPDLAKTRINCGQRCMERPTCNYCHNSLRLANILAKDHPNPLMNL